MRTPRLRTGSEAAEQELGYGRHPARVLCPRTAHAHRWAASEAGARGTAGAALIGITMNTYAHVLDDSKRRMASRMDGLFGGDG